MYRDFSNEYKKILLNLVKEVENEKYQGFADELGDGFLTFQSWIGNLNINKYLNDVSSYHRKVIDKNNATRSSINAIFDTVKSIDVSYKHKIARDNQWLQQWISYVEELSVIIDPRNGLFTSNMSQRLEELLNQIAINEVDYRIDAYCEYNPETGEYTYNWENIEQLMSKDADQLSKQEYAILVKVLETMSSKKDANGNVIVDTDNLEKFVSLGYTEPSPVTADDAHISYSDIMNPAYLQNKSYLSETFLTVNSLYQERCSITGNDTPVDDILNLIVNDYQVIEWRRKLDDNNPITTYDYLDRWNRWQVDKEFLDEFNDDCVPKIRINDINRNGVNGYSITSSAFNDGDVQIEGDILINNASYSQGEKKIEVFTDLDDDKSDSREVMDDYILNEVSKDKLDGYKENYNPTGDIVKNTAELVISFIPGVDEFGEAFGWVSDVMGYIDGAGEISSEALDARQNNNQITQDKQVLDSVYNQSIDYRDMGLTYDTVVIESYPNEERKNIASVQKSGVSFDSKTLRCSYNRHLDDMPKGYSEEDFSELEAQMQEYLYNEDYVVEKGTILDDYLRTCRASKR